MRDDAEFEVYIEHRHLIDSGLLDPDQPTRWAHMQHRRVMRAEFTPSQRAQIRSALGMIADGAQP